jgi:putative transposase
LACRPRSRHSTISTKVYWLGSKSSIIARFIPRPVSHPVDPLTLRNAFLFQAARRVTKTAQINFQGNRYTVPGYLVGQLVQLHYNPFDLSTLEIWYNGQCLTNAQASHLAVAIQPGLTPDPTPPPARPTTGTDYLAMLRQERERLLREQLPPIPFTRLSPAQPLPSEE